MIGDIGHEASQEKGLSPRLPEEGRRRGNGTQDVSEMLSPEKAPLSTLWWTILCSSLLLAEMQASLETTMTADLQLTIINTFGEVSKFPWVNVTYSLALGSSCFFW